MSAIKIKRCEICNKYNDLKQNLLYCYAENCERWIHGVCKKSRYSNLEKKWFCKLHRKATHGERSFVSSENDENFKTIIVSSDDLENMHNEDKPGKSPTCENCKDQILNDEYKICEFCEGLKHNTCLSAIELKSQKDENDKIICENCVFDIAQKSIVERDRRKNQVKEKHLIRINNDSTPKNKINNESDTNYLESESDDESRDYVTFRSNHRQKNKKAKNETAESYFQKLSVRKLPHVVDCDLSWTLFYGAFEETKSLFTDYDQV